MIELDLTPEQLEAIAPLFVEGFTVLATIHKHRPFAVGMKSEDIGKPIMIVGHINNITMKKLREIVRSEQA